MTTQVVIPINRNKDENEFKSWCYERIGFQTSWDYESRAATWSCDRKAMLFLVFTFGEEMDAMAFKLRFGL